MTLGKMLSSFLSNQLICFVKIILEYLSFLYLILVAFVPNMKSFYPHKPIFSLSSYSIVLLECFRDTKNVLFCQVLVIRLSTCRENRVTLVLFCSIALESLHEHNLNFNFSLFLCIYLPI